MDDLFLSALEAMEFVPPSLYVGLLPALATSSGVPPELKAALVTLTEQIETNPHDAEAYFRRGAVCQGLGERVAAYADLREALHRQPEHARAWLLLSEVLNDLKHYDHARTARQRALEIDPRLGE